MNMSKSLRLVSILGFLVTIAAMIALATRHALFGESFLPIGIQILAVSLMIWARVTFGWRSLHAAGNPTEGGLVTSGPYKYVRHPIYAAVLYFAWAGVLSHLSVTNIILGICAIGGAVLRMAVEEKLVAKRYPEYGAYANRTARVIPFLV
jgi:protein-S-isoprenylcysteine O-methyltransferase Ste14